MGIGREGGWSRMYAAPAMNKLADTYLAITQFVESKGLSASPAEQYLRQLQYPELPGPGIPTVTRTTSRRD